MPLIVLWCLLLVVNWPLALLTLIAWPIYWLYFAPTEFSVLPVRGHSSTRFLG